MVFGYYILGDRVSQQCLIAIAVITFGYVIGAVGGIRDKKTSDRGLADTIIGIVYGLLSSGFVALYGIYVKKILPVVNKDTWYVAQCCSNKNRILLIYNTLLATIVLVPIIVISGELQAVVKHTFLTKIDFWAVMCVSAFCGYMINIAYFLQIKYTSPLTNTISGTAKACVQTLMGWAMFGEILSLLV